jgi:hypothetical protein
MTSTCTQSGINDFISPGPKKKKKKKSKKWDRRQRLKAPPTPNAQNFFMYIFYFNMYELGKIKNIILVKDRKIYRMRCMVFLKCA